MLLGFSSAQNIAYAILTDSINDLRRSRFNLTNPNGKIAKLDRQLEEVNKSGIYNNYQLRKQNAIINEKNSYLRDVEENKRFINSKRCAQLCELVNIDHVWLIETLKEQNLL